MVDNPKPLEDSVSNTAVSQDGTWCPGLVGATPSTHCHRKDRSKSGYNQEEELRDSAASKAFRRSLRNFPSTRLEADRKRATSSDGIFTVSSLPSMQQNGAYFSVSSVPRCSWDVGRATHAHHVSGSELPDVVANSGKVAPELSL